MPIIFHRENDDKSLLSEVLYFHIHMGVSADQPRRIDDTFLLRCSGLR